MRRLRIIQANRVIRPAECAVLRRGGIKAVRNGALYAVDIESGEAERVQLRPDGNGASAHMAFGQQVWAEEGAR